MRTLSIIAAAAALVVVGAVIWFFSSYPAYTHRYRLTIEVEVGGAIRSGSSVIEVRWQKQPSIGQAGPWVSRVIGKAILIDLGSRGALLAALRPVEFKRALWQGTDFIALRAFNSAASPKQSRGFPLTDEVLRTLSNLRGSTTLGPTDLPQFIWLSDLGDPKTAIAVLPEEFSEVIGPNVRLRAATVEMTSAPIASDLEHNLPWLSVLHEQQRTRGTIFRPGQFHLEANYLSGGV